jgi:hypothetical protein
LTVREHQRRTVENWEELQDLSAGTDEVIPVLQGYDVGEYLDHL